jgi:predicted DNA-binding protein with PD1-like motif
MKTVSIRLKTGDDLLVKIKEIVIKHRIYAGIVLSAVGSLSSSNIRVPIIDKLVKHINPNNLEIDSVNGTISINGCHLHITVSDLNGKAFGGHIKEGCIIRTTCEIVIGILNDTKFVREFDNSTGFDELVIK